MIEKAYKESVVLWQTAPEEVGVAEKAILIEVFQDVISLKQDGNDININYESIKELRKFLLQYQK